MDDSSVGGCPHDPELLRHLGSDLDSPASLLKHLEECPRCEVRLARLQTEVTEINTLAAGITFPAASEIDESASEGPASVNRFIDDLKRSGLADDDQVDSWCLESDSEVPNATTLAATLVLKDHLTPFQASRLLDGNPQGVSLGNHKLIEPLGRGGMGMVFKAEHVTLRRLDALKVLQENLTGDRRAVSRFLREAQLLAAMSHENIVRVHDLGREEQRYYIVMEYVPGGSLKQRLAESGRLGVEESVGLVLQVALALEHAHQHGIIHRDVKPSNILVTPEGQAKLADLGLAKAFDETIGSSETVRNLTLTGTLIGTINYMSPEQAEDPRRADIRSDLYALGCTLYECLAGEVPFVARNRAAQLLLAREGRVRRIDEVNESIPAAVGNLTHRLMARLPEDRYQTPTEAVEALRECLSLINSPPSDSPAVPGRATDRREVRPGVRHGVDGQVDRGDAGSQASSGRDLEEAVLAIHRARITESGRRSPADRDRRSPRRGRNDRKWFSVLAAVGIVAAVVTWAVWPSPQPGILEVRLSSELVGLAQVRLAGQDLMVFGEGPLRISRPPGHYRLAVSARGFVSRETDVEVVSGRTVVHEVELSPLPAALQVAVRFATLKTRVDAVLSGPVDTVLAASLRDEVLEIPAEPAGLAFQRECLGLLKRLPSPSDGLLPDRIPSREIESARVGPSRSLPAGLVAVFGDSRMKHWSRVHGLAASPDARILVSASYDATLRTWDPMTGELRLTMQGHVGPVTSVAISPDARIVASGSHDQSIRLWRTDDGSEIRQLSAQAGIVWSVDFSDDGATLASAHHSGEVNLWKTADGSRVSGVQAHLQPALAVRFAPGGTRLATAGLDHTVKIWEAGDFKLLQTLTGHTQGVQTIDYSPDGHRLASGGQDGMVRIWDVATGKQVRELAASGHVATVAYDPTGRLLLFDTGNASLIWDVALDKRHVLLGKHLSSVISSCFLGKSGVVVTGGYEGTIKSWDAETGEERRPIPTAWTTAFDPSGRLLAVGFENGEVEQYELATGQLRSRFSAHRDAVVSVVFDPTGRQLGTGGYDGNCHVWDAATGQPPLVSGRHAALVNSVAFAPDGNWFASGGWDRIVRLWPLDRAGATPREFPPGGGYVREVAFSPDRKWLAWAGQAGDITLYHLEEDVLRVIGDSGSRVMSLGFNHDGRRLAVMRDSGQVELWDMRARRLTDWKPERPFDSYGLAARFDPGGFHVAMAATRGSVRMADALTGRHKGEIRVGPEFGRIWHVRFSPSGRYMATVNGNGTVYLLRLDSDQ